MQVSSLWIFQPLDIISFPVTPCSMICKNLFVSFTFVHLSPCFTVSPIQQASPCFLLCGSCAPWNLPKPNSYLYKVPTHSFLAVSWNQLVLCHKLCCVVQTLPSLLTDDLSLSLNCEFLEKELKFYSVKKLTLQLESLFLKDMRCFSSKCYFRITKPKLIYFHGQNSL